MSAKSILAKSLALLVCLYLAALAVSLYADYATTHVRIEFSRSGDNALWIEKSHLLLYQSTAHIYVVSYYIEDRQEGVAYAVYEPKTVQEGNVVLANYSDNTPLRERQFLVVCSNEVYMSYAEVMNAATADNSYEFATGTMLYPGFGIEHAIVDGAMPEPTVLTCK